MMSVLDIADLRDLLPWDTDLTQFLPDVKTYVILVGYQAQNIMSEDMPDLDKVCT